MHPMCTETRRYMCVVVGERVSEIYFTKRQSVRVNEVLIAMPVVTVVLCLTQPGLVASAVPEHWGGVLGHRHGFERGMAFGGEPRR